MSAFGPSRAWPILRPGRGQPWRHLYAGRQFFAWVVFALDYVARVRTARECRRYVARHLLDLLIVVRPILRPPRLSIPFRIVNRRTAKSMRGTARGRCIAVGLMIGGVALVGIVTVSSAAWIVDRARQDEAAKRAATRREETLRSRSRP